MYAASPASETVLELFSKSNLCISGLEKEWRIELIGEMRGSVMKSDPPEKETGLKTNGINCTL